MVKELKHGQMDQSTKENIHLAKGMEKDSLNDVMVAVTKVIFLIIALKALDNIFELAVGVMLDIEKIIKCMEKVSLNGKMAGHMKVNIMIIKNKASVS